MKRDVASVKVESPTSIENVFVRVSESRHQR